MCPDVCLTMEVGKVVLPIGKGLGRKEVRPEFTVCPYM
jgi:hypothetical protein